jgi:hypothetical protein
MMALDQALNDIMQLDASSREMLLDILLKRQVERRRDGERPKRKKVHKRLLFW